MVIDPDTPSTSNYERESESFKMFKDVISISFIDDSVREAMSDVSCHVPSVEICEEDEETIPCYLKATPRAANNDTEYNADDLIYISNVDPQRGIIYPPLVLLQRHPSGLTSITRIT